MDGASQEGGRGGRSDNAVWRNDAGECLRTMVDKTIESGDVSGRDVQRILAALQTLPKSNKHVDVHRLCLKLLCMVLDQMCGELRAGMTCLQLWLRAVRRAAATV